MRKASYIKNLHDLFMTLTPGRYVGIEDEEDDGVPFEEKMERLAGELGILLSQSGQLDERIIANLRDIGYDIGQ